MPFYNLLTEKLISVRYENGVKENLTLPGVLAKLSNEDIESFTALQPHQEQAWYCFLVQLAAMAMHESGVQTIGADENEWAGRLRTLTKDFPKDEPWCMVAEDLSKPAFMQTPVPEGNLNNYRNIAHTPEDIDTPIKSRNHDIKMNLIFNPNCEHWLFSLISLQTTQGYLGRDPTRGECNYGIIRMNGGSANRVFLQLISNENFSRRFYRDIKVLRINRNKIAENYGYKKEKGKCILWIDEWNGYDQLKISDFDPFFLEICRRVRCRFNDGIFSTLYGMSQKERIFRIKKGKGKSNDGTEFSGITGDPWAPIDSTDIFQKVLSLSKIGFRYALIRNILWDEAQYKKAVCLEAQDSENEDLILICKGMVRGQGKTEGLFERKIIVPGKNRFSFDIEIQKKKLSEISKVMLNTIEKMMRGENKIRGFEYCLKPLTNDEYPSVFIKDLDNRIDIVFFNFIQEMAERDIEEINTKWLKKMFDLGDHVFLKAIKSTPLKTSTRFKSIAEAQNRYEYLKKQMNPQFTGGVNG